MEIEEEVLQPVSPIGQYFSTCLFSLSVIAVLELEIPFDDSQATSLVRDVFLPINPRFSSIMVVNDKGKKQWKKVEVNIKDHIKIPILCAKNSAKLYDESLNEYISKLAMEKFKENKPLWEIHIIKYPTKEAAESIIFKLHHALGDGFSLMGALLSCLQRADQPCVPLTFPCVKIHTKTKGNNYNNNCKKILKIVPKIMGSIYYTVSDIYSAIGFRCGFVKDDISPIRSGHLGGELLPAAVITMSFSLDSIKQIKSMLGVSVNDVISGTMFLGSRLYMEAMSKGSGKSRATSMVMLNTRMFRGYKSIQEMLKPDSQLRWGNNFTFLTVPIPKHNGCQLKDPLQFVWKARQIIQRKRTSLAIHFTSMFLRFIAKYRGSEVVSKYIHRSCQNTSLGITNVMGPVEHMALANHPINGFYFVVSGAPQSMIGIVSYMGRLKVSALMEKDFIDPDLFKLYVQNAFDLIFKAACGTSPPIL